MKKYILGFIFVFHILASGLIGQLANEISVPLSQTGKRGKIHIDIKKGQVSVKGTAREDVLIRYTNNEDPQPKLEEAKDGLKKISGGVAGLEIIEKDNHVYIESESWSKGVSVTVEVPVQIHLPE